jgi:hypothetical protein
MEYVLCIDGREVARSGAIRPLLRAVDRYALQYSVKSVSIELVTDETE